FQAPFPFTQPASPSGVAPTVALASDNTLGSFSPFQGRIYVAYTATFANGNIVLATSDDGGVTWTTPRTVNDDSASDFFSGGQRPQSLPAAAVAQSPGTLVLSWYDARNDAANARVATYVTASIDGGNTFSPQTFVNASMTATDAITGKSVTLEPIPDNQSGGT